MADRLRMEARLLGAALWRRRAPFALAVLALTIGTSVASALLHVSGDVSRKLSRELRSLGPNLLLVPPDDAGAGADREGTLAHYLDEGAVRARLARSGVDGAPLLYVVARVGVPGEVGEETVQLVGADLPAARRLHPAWSAPADAPSLMGKRLMDRLGVRPGEPLVLAVPGGGRIELPAGARLDAGGAEDDAWWIPLAAAQRLAGLPGRVSLAQARVADVAHAERAARGLEAGGGMRALVLHALSATEARLLQRMRRLMALVTAVALVAGGVSAFGTLMDLALERRREIALMKALGAGERAIVRQFALESLVVGFAGGLSGWLLGLVFAELIGRQVFRAAIAVSPAVPPLVIALGMVVAGLAGLGPIRMALRVQPAAVLKGD